MNLNYFILYIEYKYPSLHLASSNEFCFIPSDGSYYYIFYDPSDPFAIQKLAHEVGHFLNIFDGTWDRLNMRDIARKSKHLESLKKNESFKDFSFKERLISLFEEFLAWDKGYRFIHNAGYEGKFSYMNIAFKCLWSYVAWYFWR